LDTYNRRINEQQFAHLFLYHCLDTYPDTSLPTIEKKIKTLELKKKNFTGKGLCCRYIKALCYVNFIDIIDPLKCVDGRSYS